MADIHAKNAGIITADYDPKIENYMVKRMLADQIRALVGKLRGEEEEKQEPPLTHKEALASLPQDIQPVRRSKEELQEIRF